MLYQLRYTAMSVRQKGLEPSPHCWDQPLKLACLPFHHCRINVWINWFQTDLDRFFSNRKYFLLLSHIGTFDVISGLCSVLLSYTLSEKNSLKSRRTTANYGIAANQDICSSSNVIVGMERLELSLHLELAPKASGSTIPPHPLARTAFQRFRYPFQQPG